MAGLKTEYGETALVDYSVTPQSDNTQAKGSIYSLQNRTLVSASKLSLDVNDVSQEGVAQEMKVPTQQDSGVSLQNRKEN